jgi:protein SCO1/2
MPLDAPSAAPAAPRPSAYTLATVGAILLAAGMAVALVGVRTLRPTRPDPPRLAALPAFRLTERSGQPLTLALLRGRPWIADFIFTQCAGACPAMTARLARLQSEVPGLTFVSFTVDPAHDTPEVLARYAASFHAGPGWLFATGSQQDLYALSVGGFKMAAMEVPVREQVAGGDGPFLHSSKFVLVDGEGQVRGYYDSTDEQALRALVADVERLRARR